jgi:hypothetical protein
MENPSLPARTPQLETAQASTRIPLWVAIVVVLGALLTMMGALIGKLNPGLLASGPVTVEAVRVYADYMFARNLALALMLFFLLALRARRMLAGFMVLIALIQVIDLGDDLARGAFVLVPGLLVFVIVFLAGAWMLFGGAIWRARVWRAS